MKPCKLRCHYLPIGWRRRFGFGARRRSSAWILGWLSFRLPGLVAPQAYAHAWSSGDRAFDVEVSVRIPVLGVLMSYSGHFMEAEE